MRVPWQFLAPAPCGPHGVKRVAAEISEWQIRGEVASPFHAPRLAVQCAGRADYCQGAHRHFQVEPTPPSGTSLGCGPVCGRLPLATSPIPLASSGRGRCAQIPGPRHGHAGDVRSLGVPDLKRLMSSELLPQRGRSLRSCSTKSPGLVRWVLPAGRLRWVCARSSARSRPSSQQPTRNIAVRGSSLQIHLRHRGNGPTLAAAARSSTLDTNLARSGVRLLT